MKILLDEDVAEPFVEMIRHLLPDHQIETVRTMHWNGRKDVALYTDAKGRGFNVVISANHRQLEDPEETRAIRRSGLHVVYFGQGDGLEGLGRTAATLLCSIVPVIRDLEEVTSQRIVTIPLLNPRKRHKVTDPQRDPPRYWKT